MPRCLSREFGELEYDEAAVVHFPSGLPAFEHERRFLLIERSESAPAVFLQSLATPSLLFLALPARVIDPAFSLGELSADERGALGLAEEKPTGYVEGEDLLSLALVTAREGAPVTANLLAPVVIGARSRHALQIVMPDSGYRVDQPLPGAATACS